MPQLVLDRSIWSRAATTCTHEAQKGLPPTNRALVVSSCPASMLDSVVAQVPELVVSLLPTSILDDVAAHRLGGEGAVAPITHSYANDLDPTINRSVKLGTKNRS
jgi:hypothetical protein